MDPGEHHEFPKIEQIKSNIFNVKFNQCSSFLPHMILETYNCPDYDYILLERRPWVTHRLNFRYIDLF